MNDEQSPDRGDASGGRDRPYSEELQYSQVSARVPEKVARGVFSTGAVVLNGAHEFIIDFLLRMTQPHQVAARVILPPPVIPRFIAALRENLANYGKKYGAPQLPQLLPAVPPAAQSFTAHAGPVPGLVPEAVSEAPQVVSSPGGEVPPGGGEPQGGGSAGSESEGTPPVEASQAQPPRVSAQELYEQLKLPDEMLSGTYANTVMIGHTATEFSFDFITSFFPRSAVACRVYLAAPNVPRFLDSLVHSFDQYQRRGANPPPPAPDPPRPDDEP